MKIVLTKKGKKYFVKDLNQNFHIADGMIKKKDLKKNGEIKTNTGKKVLIYPATFIDEFYNLKRGAQVIHSKDICAIIANTGIGKDSFVIDAGTGSGFTACFLGNIVKKVVSYDKDKQALEIAKKNIKNKDNKKKLAKKKNLNKKESKKKTKKLKAKEKKKNKPTVPVSSFTDHSSNYNVQNAVSKLRSLKSQKDVQAFTNGEERTTITRLIPGMMKKLEQ